MSHSLTMAIFQPALAPPGPGQSTSNLRYKYGCLSVGTSQRTSQTWHCFCGHILADNKGPMQKITSPIMIRFPAEILKQCGASRAVVRESEEKVGIPCAKCTVRGTNPTIRYLAQVGIKAAWKLQRPSNQRRWTNERQVSRLNIGKCEPFRCDNYVSNKKI